MSPAQQLRQLLQVEKRAGRPFEDAFPACLKLVRWPHATDDRRFEKSVLGDGKTVPTPDATWRWWRDAYEDRPAPPGAAALMTLADLLADMDEQADLPTWRPGPRVVFSMPESAKAKQAA